jgi:cytochrome P450
MMVRETTKLETFRDLQISIGSSIVISPWHLYRQSRLWDKPDGFDPTRWQTENGKKCQREAFIPFSAGSPVCLDAGFAMIEGPLLLATILKGFKVSREGLEPPAPVVHFTARSKDGIHLGFKRYT